MRQPVRHYPQFVIYKIEFSSSKIFEGFIKQYLGYCRQPARRYLTESLILASAYSCLTRSHDIEELSFQEFRDSCSFIEILGYESDGELTLAYRSIRRDFDKTNIENRIWSAAMPYPDRQRWL